MRLKSRAGRHGIPPLFCSAGLPLSAPSSLVPFRPSTPLASRSRHSLNLHFANISALITPIPATGHRVSWPTPAAAASLR